MRIEHAGWVVIADAGRFLVLENKGDADIMDLRVRAAETNSSEKQSSVGRDRPGRLSQEGSRRVAAVETDWHNLNEKAAAEDLGKRISAWSQSKAFEKLLLVADPKSLGVVRKHIADSEKHRVTTAAADLVHLSVPEIEAWVRAHEPKTL